jgi:hypothetical protein
MSTTILILQQPFHDLMSAQAWAGYEAAERPGVLVVARTNANHEHHGAALVVQLSNPGREKLKRYAAAGVVARVFWHVGRGCYCAEINSERADHKRTDRCVSHETDDFDAACAWVAQRVDHEVSWARADDEVAHG